LTHAGLKNGVLDTEQAANPTAFQALLGRHSGLLFGRESSFVGAAGAGLVSFIFIHDIHTCAQQAIRAIAVFARDAGA
jgi:hypothetical protein